MQLMTFADMVLLDQVMRSSPLRSNNEGLALAMKSKHEGSNQRPPKEDGLLKVRLQNEPERSQMRRVVSLPMEEIASLEEYSSAEEVKTFLSDAVPKITFKVERWTVETFCEHWAIIRQTFFRRLAVMRRKMEM